MRSVLGGDNENEMQGSDLDGCDVEQEGEEELRKKKKKEGSLAGAIQAVGAARSGLAKAWRQTMGGAEVGAWTRAQS